MASSPLHTAMPSSVASTGLCIRPRGTVARLVRKRHYNRQRLYLRIHRKLWPLWSGSERLRGKYRQSLEPTGCQDEEDSRSESLSEWCRGRQLEAESWWEDFHSKMGESGELLGEASPRSERLSEWCQDRQLEVESWWEDFRSEMGESGELLYEASPTRIPR